MTSIISGDNYTFTVQDFMGNKEKLIERNGLTGDSSDTTPSAVGIGNILTSDSIGLSFSFLIYNNSEFIITMNTGTGFTMKPGPTDTIHPNTVKRYLILITSLTTCNIFNMDHNGQPIFTERVITNTIEKEPGTTEVTIFQNATNIILGSGGSSANDDGSMTVYGNLFKFSSVADLTASTSLTYSVGQILGGLILRNPGSSNRTDTLPTAADIVAAIPKVEIGTSFVTHISNSGEKKTVTISPGAGITIGGGDRSISRERTKIFMFVVSNKEEGTEAVTAYILGSLLDSDDTVGSLITEVRDNSYTVLETDNTINVNTYYTWGAKCVITLPEISTLGQKRYFITDSGGYAGNYSIVVVPSGSDTIMGSDSVTINSKYSSISMYNDEVSNWILY